ncbi:hypothetical protein [Flavobacterium sp.]|uniref:hypothetical protein n=1 Tax=Flavobacterium sp. TaxID=239 RepID=UPI003750E161
MKKIILLLTTLLTIISCSINNDNKATNSLQDELVGSWKFVGFYNYFDIDQADNPHIEYYNNGNILHFNSNNTFEEVGEINYNGTYTITADSVLTRFYNASEQNNSFTNEVKIVKLNDSIFDFTCTKEDNIGLCPCDANRHIKIN